VGLFLARPVGVGGVGRGSSLDNLRPNADDGAVESPSQNPRPASNLALIGGGGHALVVADAAVLASDPRKRAIIGVFDDAEHPAICGAMGLDRLGSLSEGGRGVNPWILCLGNVGLRRKWLDAWATQHDARSAGGGPSIVVHPQAAISPSATLGVGVFVGPRAVVHTQAKIGDHAIINSGAIVEHECQIGENSHIAPGTVLGGNVAVGRDCLIGLGSRVLPGVKIGDGCTVGAGSVVLKDLAAGSKVVGSPARSID
jgi:sugar O-acyltransferase (sialic acid O-acetyltransferase NeuD family)